MGEKKIIILNGKGGVGKDTLCKIAAKHYKTDMVSSIDPIKRIAEQIGWDGVKDSKSRRFLSELKRLCAEFNDFPTQYLMQETKKFFESEKVLLFVQIREPSEIDKFKSAVKGRFGITCHTLLIEQSHGRSIWENESDDNVTNYNYDYRYVNDSPLEQTEDCFIAFLSSYMQKSI